MGKAKKRSINLGKHNQIASMTRNEAVTEVVKRFKRNESVLDLVTMFGLSAEELLEGGALYKEVKSIEGILDV